ncbi:UDP-N-acetylmuramoyl-L-alanyl-D-glutamate--2,6-diaminopimelate ligase, partial [bacterium]|nr:UDP-N-acetylmuramoyl-L-alanyl-D-glutamate--2,6-diaminopimelate ligase [bacterium]
MKLEELIENLHYKELLNFKNVDINGISYNSQTTKKDDIFVCISGEHTDGHKFYQKAVEAGASAFMVETPLETHLPQIVVESTKRQIADIAGKFYDYPSESLNLIGITGTNGKTTVTHLIQKILEYENQPCALIGTLGYKLNSADSYKEAKHTTPQAPELQNLLYRIKNQEISNVAMEVSSHSLEQNRVGQCSFKGAVFTNLTQYHLDYHKTMDNYFDAKAMLFKNLKEGAFAVINNDDEYSKRFLETIPQGVKVLTYGVKTTSDIMAQNIEFMSDGSEFDYIVNGKHVKRVRLSMSGMFSIYNILAATACAIAMGISENAIDSLLYERGVAGRFETVVKNPLVIVDYAHTPDGLENVLNAAREITPKDGKLICLFGCGGDRDATKRPKMASIAEQIADIAVVTSDNPRSEDPLKIIDDVLKGFKNPQKAIVEPDRGSAIALLKTIAKENDVVIVAGKGHEDYQILKDKTIHFDDREEVK